MTPARLSLSLAIAWACGVAAGGPRPALAQAAPGRLEQLGGPASLLRRTLAGIEGFRALEGPERGRWEPVYRGEAAGYGPTQQWLGSGWTLRLAAVGDTVFRVTVETFTPDRTDADRLLMALNALLVRELGEPNQEDCSDFRWGATDGEVFLRTTDVTEGRRTTVVFTSDIIRSLIRL